MEESVIVPSSVADYVELARTKTGRIFKKHILSKGTLLYPGVPGGKIEVDDAFLNSLKTNFDSNVCPIVQVPLANDKNEHSEAPERNLGEVVDLKIEGGKAYAVIDVREKDAQDRMGTTYLGASAFLNLNYPNTKTQERVGPTLLHMCVTNRPYVTDLEDYQEILAATADDSSNAVILTQELAESIEVNTKELETSEEIPMATLEELVAQLKEEHGIDVRALEGKAADGEAATKLTQTLAEALVGAGAVKLSNTETITPEELEGAVAQLAQGHITLTATLEDMQKTAAEVAVDAFISAGRIIPAERDARIELKLTNSEMFDKLLPTEPIIKMQEEVGVTPSEDEATQKHFAEEIARLTAPGGAAEQYVRSN